MAESALPKNPSVSEVSKFFEGDKFAYGLAGCRVVSAANGSAVCEMQLTKNHYNAAGSVMGGAIFTLADFCLGVASNINEPPTVAVNNTIEFMSKAKGNKLIATCSVNKSGHSLGFYTVDVTDNTGRAVAKMTATCYR